MPEGKEFEVVGDIQKLIEAEKTEGKADEVEKTEATSAEAKSSTNGKASNGSGNEVEGKFRHKWQYFSHLLSLVGLSQLEISINDYIFQLYHLGMR